MASTDGRIVETRRVPVRTRFVIKFLAWIARRRSATALGQVDETDLKREAGSGNERERKTGDAPKPSQAPQAAAVQTRTRALLRVRPACAVMSERKADRTIVVGEDRRRVAVLRAGCDEGRRASW